MLRIELRAAVIGKRVYMEIFVVDSEIIHAMIQRELYEFKTYSRAILIRLLVLACCVADNFSELKVAEDYLRSVLWIY